MASTAPGARSGAWLWFLVAGALLTQTALNLVRPVTTYKLLSLDADSVTVGLVTAAYAVVPLVTAMWLGRMTDRVRDLRTMVVVGALVFAWYAGTDDVPNQVVSATPYVVTLVVLALSAQRLRMPRANGMPYRKGQGK